MRLRYRQRLFLYFGIVFSLFTIGVLLFEQSREKRFKTEALEEQLNTYTEIIHRALTLANARDTSETSKTKIHAHAVDDAKLRTLLLDSLLQLLPSNIRLSLINTSGQVQYDNTVKNLSTLENHSRRPEIIEAHDKGQGTHIRTSSSTHHKYLYFAKNYTDYYIRVALPYDVSTRRFLETDNLFLYFILALFATMLIPMSIITGRFGKSIQQLRDFVLLTDQRETPPTLQFPKDELGEISTQITENYRQLQASKQAADSEREKLLQHVHSSEEGICFFASDREVEFFNGLFVQYLNTLIDEPTNNPAALFSDRTFVEAHRFLEQGTEQHFETILHKQGKTFSVRINLFENRSFEIILNDITQREKTRQLKQEMTGNIAHELRTPVTSIRGYLETVLEQQLEPEQERHFMRQAYRQTMVLSELIRDMSLISKIEEAPQSFQTEAIDLSGLLSDLKRDLEKELTERKIDMEWNLPKTLIIHGNRNLIHSIFRNLTDNSIRYAGENISIRISLYNEDSKFYYFSFLDTGVGISDETHLNRLFERFYRINEGRTRDSGGSGLGLSIVRNAIAFHRGTITAKNRKEGGLEFLFTLQKQQNETHLN